MRVNPDRDSFTTAYDAGKPQVVWTKLVADLETPVSAMLKFADGLENSFLLESVEGGAVLGRYSFLGFKPDLIWRCNNGKAEINRRARLERDAYEPCDAAPLDALRELLDECHIDLPSVLPPMSAGLFGYLGYDMVRLMEKLPDSNPDTLDIPEAILMRPTMMAVFDNIEHAVTLVTPVWPTAGVSADAAHEHARERLADTMADLQRNLPYRRESVDVGGELPPVTSNTSRDEYMDMVSRAKEYIHAGDAFQILPSHRFEVPFSLPPFALYRALRRLNPSPFLFYLDFGAFSVVGSSPEILVRLRDGVVTIRPLAGTRRRGRTPEEDKQLSEELLSDPKELAEHLMLVDLGRNDVGRVAEIGSVRVTEQMAVEYYSHVMHIVSNVEGRLRPEFDALDALMAGFPTGTVSGAPKVRAMEIIDELEKSRRGVYGGCIGYFGADQTMDTCIALRTAVIKDQTMYVQVGAGVVADSVPEREYEETCEKARALLRAAEEAVAFAASGPTAR